MKGRQASDRAPLNTAAGLMTQHRTGPIPCGAVPSLSRAATMAATPPVAQASCHAQARCDNVEQVHVVQLDLLSETPGNIAS